MIKKILVVSLCVGGLVMGQQVPQTPPSGPRPRGPRPEFGPGFRGLNDPNAEQHLTQRLKLNAQQQNTVHTAIEESKVILKGAVQQEQTLRTQLTAAVKAGNEGNIDQISQQLATLHQQRTATESKALAKIYGSLSADQKTVMDRELDRQLDVPRPGGRGPRPGRGPAPAQSQGAQQ